jgi:V8-like Glu-specific endopeptidase
MRRSTAPVGHSLIGALFYHGRHFSTASVLHPGVVLTAAHSVTGKAITGIIFAPGWGTPSSGPEFACLRAYTTAAWQASRDIDDDFALAQLVSGAEAMTGSLSIKTGVAQEQPSVTVTGYPDELAHPITGTSSTKAYGANQMRWAFPGCTDGTSGSPFMIGSTVIGALGGYQQGGDSPNVSDAACFRENMVALMREAGLP